MADRESEEDGVRQSDTPQCDEDTNRAPQPIFGERQDDEGGLDASSVAVVLDWLQER